jgi:hypothetical protein
VYVLDSNIFIEAKKRYYAFDVCPGFWDLLVWQHTQNNIVSIEHVKEEITFVGGDLKDWALTAMPGDCFCTTDEQGVLAAYQEGVQWVMAQDFTDAAKAEYARDGNADAWVIAYAKACGASVATEEKLNLARKNKVPIPNVCEALRIPYVDTFEMLRTLDARFSWQQP